MSEQNVENERRYKFIVVGDMGAGKTSIIQRYTNDVFSNSYKATIGVDFFMKDLTRENETVKLQLWDIAGQEMFRHMTRVYYKDSIGALLVFDVDSRSSFEVINEWKKDIDEKVRTNTNSPIPVILCANKIDLIDEESSWNKTKKEMDTICEEQGYIGWFETSAKTGQNVSESVEFLLDYILKNNIEKANSSTKKDQKIENLGEFEEISNEDRKKILDVVNAILILFKYISIDIDILYLYINFIF